MFTTTLKLRLAWLTVAFAVLEFAVRIFHGTGFPLTDIAAAFITAKLWLAGQNPYDSSLFLPSWYASGAPHVPLDRYVSVYPPTVIPFFVAFAGLSWAAMQKVFLILGLIMFLPVVYGLTRLGFPQKRWSEFFRDPRALFFLAFAIGFAPVHTAFRSQNIVLFACCFAILAIVLLLARGSVFGLRSLAVRDGLAAIAIASALCLKPTTGVFLLPWLVYERRWRVIAGAVLVCVVLAGISMGPLVSHFGTSWLKDYEQGVHTLFRGGGNASVDAENIYRTDRIDLQLALYAATGNHQLSALLPVLIYAGLLGSFLYYVRGFGSDLDASLLVAAGSLALGLIPAYSRVYSAITLLPLVLWCFGHLQLRGVKWMLLVLCDFLVNTSAVLRKATLHWGVVERHPNAWDATLGGHTCWLIALLGVLLVVTAREMRGEEAIVMNGQVEPVRLVS